MRWSTLRELAPQVGIQLPTSPLEQRQNFLITEPMKDLKSVLQKFLRTQKVLASTEILERLAFEACEDAFNDGVIVAELRYAPTFITEGHPHLNFESVHTALQKGIERAEKAFPMAAGLLGIVQRIKSFETASSVIDFMIDHKDSFIGVDLADNEDGFDPKVFASVFEKARKNGLRLTVHSGEVPNDFSPKWVRDSVEVLGAERIGHGIQIIRDPKTMKWIIDQEIPLEVCPLSNWLTQAFPDHESHPLRQLKNAGVLVTLNSDDPGIFASTLTDDYEIAHRVHHFTLNEFNEVNETAVQHSFIDKAKIQRVWPTT